MGLQTSRNSKSVTIFFFGSWITISWSYCHWVNTNPPSVFTHLCVYGVSQFFIPCVLCNAVVSSLRQTILCVMSISLFLNFYHIKKLWSFKNFDLCMRSLSIIMLSCSLQKPSIQYLFKVQATLVLRNTNRISWNMYNNQSCHFPIPQTQQNEIRLFFSTATRNKCPSSSSSLH